MQRVVAARNEAMRIVLAAEDDQSAQISRMLHDNVGQYVAALQLGFRGLERELDTGKDVRLTLQSLHTITQSVAEELHKVALELRPSSLDDHGLVRSLGTLLDEWSLLNNTAVDFEHVALGEKLLPRYLETALFRIIRDMLRIVAQQTGMGQVNVILMRQLDYVVAVVEHNGKPLPGGGEGGGDDPLRSIKARVALLEGTLAVEDCATSGWAMIARLPGNLKV